mmetsp:Transcript_30050/g.28720  ORF Transcript_30050/g.28720 Transcript_30050/m.28720 type:complete len:579 (+) Transcript_30050:96-1832(+)|eukprot:CAMPEP_0119035132 /NCGR_PEP_ID=MMETSP1177-20130426/2095_1 /TAXON_ID=2985 /ORGANISM="Ochromonas sp, Strain CCMP1899" /LENGTH=578 /DNA_ID=CAMNT_0006993067 /DNA_START=82 /DNA_END=1818 /DNA_ORIENTATION=+
MEDQLIKEKKEKKEKKRKNREKDEEVVECVEESSTAAGGDLDDEEVAAKRAKKEAKKLRKLGKTNVTEEVEAPQEEVIVKKVKKEKSRESAILAGVVGDLVPKKGSKISSNNYVEHSSTTSMMSTEIATYREEVGLQVIPQEDSDKYNPMISFDYLNESLQNYCPDVKKYLKEKNFKKPSAIQAQCWPPLLSGRDVIGIAMTGSGKTLAFLIPAILKISKAGPLPGAGKGGAPSPRVLVVAPTRELAMQSHQVCLDVGGLKSVCIYGGVPKQQQKADLRAGAEVVVATPGRLLDLLEEGHLVLSSVCYLVLDEADRMLDDGFEPAIRQIIAKCPAAGDSITDRQTAMFSATWPEEIRALADKFLRKDVMRVIVGGEELNANHMVTQIVECIEGGYAKDKKLLTLLDQYHKSRKNRILIFVLYKKEAVTLQNTLAAKGFNVTAIHGDKSQHDRTAALEEFKSGKTPLLIATDVAARGLDIPQVEYVINYSFPLTVEDYVHRIGRTGRGGATGISHTFFTDFDKTLAGALVAVLQEAKQEIPQEIYQYPMVTKKKSSKLYGDFGPKADLQGKKSTKITFD